MLTGTLAITLGASLLLGLLGLGFFIWGLKSGQFDDKEKFDSVVMFDSEEDLNAAKEMSDKKNRQQSTKLEN